MAGGSVVSGCWSGVGEPRLQTRLQQGMGPSWTDYVGYGRNVLFRRSALTVDMNRSPARISDAADRAEAEAMQRDPLVVRYSSLRYLLAQKRVMDRCVANQEYPRTKRPRLTSKDSVSAAHSSPTSHRVLGVSARIQRVTAHATATTIALPVSSAS